MTHKYAHSNLSSHIRYMNSKHKGFRAIPTIARTIHAYKNKLFFFEFIGQITMQNAIKHNLE